MHSLVMGLFIPQWGQSERALIRIADPESEDLERALSDISNESLIAGICQIALAKHFGLMGLTSISNYLATTKTQDLGVFPSHVRAQFLQMEGQNDSRHITFIHDHPVPAFGPDVPSRPPFTRIHFEMSYPTELLLEFMNGIGVSETVQDLAQRRSGWEAQISNEEVSLLSPFGFKMILSVD